MNALFLAWLAEVGIITWRGYRKQQRAPIPSELVATFVVFGALSLIPEPYDKWGSIAGWGFVVATLLDANAANNVNGFLVQPHTSAAPAPAVNNVQSPKKAPATQGPKFA